MSSEDMMNFTTKKKTSEMLRKTLQNEWDVMIATKEVSHTPASLRTLDHTPIPANPSPPAAPRSWKTLQNEWDVMIATKEVGEKSHYFKKFTNPDTRRHVTNTRTWSPKSFKFSLNTASFKNWRDCYFLLPLIPLQGSQGGDIWGLHASHQAWPCAYLFLKQMKF